MIRLQDVTKVYEGGTVAARDVNLDIQRGEIGAAEAVQRYLDSVE